MNLQQLVTSLALLAITIATGVIGFFLKRTIGQVDCNTSEIKDIKKEYATKAELDSFKDDIKDDISKISQNVDDIKDNYIKKDDFVRAMSDMNTEVRRIFDYLLKQNGGKTNG